MQVTVFSGEIELGGTVFDENNNPKSGVIVSLALAGLAATTTSDGKWSILSDTIPDSADPSDPPVSLIETQLQIDLSNEESIKVELFSALGVQTHLIQNGVLSKGLQQFTLPANSQDISFLRITSCSATSSSVSISSSSSNTSSSVLLSSSSVIYIAQGQEHVKNGSFDNTYDHWNFVGTANGITSTFNEYFRATMTDTTVANDNPQLYQALPGLRSNSYYRLRFLAKSATSYPITVKLQESGGSF